MRAVVSIFGHVLIFWTIFFLILNYHFVTRFWASWISYVFPIISSFFVFDGILAIFFRSSLTWDVQILEVNIACREQWFVGLLRRNYHVEAFLYPPRFFQNLEFCPRLRPLSKIINGIFWPSTFSWKLHFLPEPETDDFWIGVFVRKFDWIQNWWQ